MGNTYSFKRRFLFSIGPHLLGLIFMVVGIFTLASPWFIKSDATVTKSLLVGISFILFGLVTVTSYSGVFFDFKENTFQRYYSFAGFRSGQRQALPLLKLVKVFPHTFKGSPISNGVNPTPTLTVTQYVVALYAEQAKPIIALEYNNKNLALEGAKVISDGLKVELEVKL